MSLEKRNPQDTKPISPAKEQNAKQIKARKSAQLLQLNKILLKIAELSEQKIINREAELISILEEYFSFLKLLSTRRMTDTLSILEKSSIETLIELGLWEILPDDDNKTVDNDDEIPTRFVDKLCEKIQFSSPGAWEESYFLILEASKVAKYFFDNQEASVSDTNGGLDCSFDSNTLYFSYSDSPLETYFPPFSRLLANRGFLRELHGTILSESMYGIRVDRTAAILLRFLFPLDTFLLSLRPFVPVFVRWMGAEYGRVIIAKNEKKDEQTLSEFGCNLLERMLSCESKIKLSKTEPWSNRRSWSTGRESHLNTIHDQTNDDEPYYDFKNDIMYEIIVCCERGGFTVRDQICDGNDTLKKSDKVDVKEREKEEQFGVLWEASQVGGFRILIDYLETEISRSPLPRRAIFTGLRLLSLLFTFAVQNAKCLDILYGLGNEQSEEGKPHERIGEAQCGDISKRWFTRIVLNQLTDRAPYTPFSGDFEAVIDARIPNIVSKILAWEPQNSSEDEECSHDRTKFSREQENENHSDNFFESAGLLSHQAQFVKEASFQPMFPWIYQYACTTLYCLSSFFNILTSGIVWSRTSLWRQRQHVGTRITSSSRTVLPNSTLGNSIQTTQPFNLVLDSTSLSSKIEQVHQVYNPYVLQIFNAFHADLSFRLGILPLLLLLVRNPVRCGYEPIIVSSAIETLSVLTMHCSERVLRNRSILSPDLIQQLVEHCVEGIKQSNFVGDVVRCIGCLVEARHSSNRDLFIQAGGVEMLIEFAPQYVQVHQLALMMNQLAGFDEETAVPPDVDILRLFWRYGIGLVDGKVPEFRRPDGEINEMQELMEA